jgi:phenylalanyl-tRNA synthetase alpha chain
MLYSYKQDSSEVINALSNRNDAKAHRIQKMTNLPDLTRTENSPIYFITEAIKQVNLLKDFDIVEFPEIVSVEENFDYLDTPDDHPSRRESDTFYLTSQNVLRTQTTTMWSYYLKDNEALKKLYSNGLLQAISYGKVYRNDEIDRSHYPVFHQVDGLSICSNKKKIYQTEDLVDVLVAIAKSIYGNDVKWRVEDDTFPFTSQSIELQIWWNDEWIEVLGAGLVHKKVLGNLGLDPQKYNGWAFGFGLDRLAMIKMDIPDIRIVWSTDDRIQKQFTSIESRFVEVSKYPPTDRDISFLVNKNLSLNLIYELMRDCGYYENEDIIEDVKIIDTYDDEKKFGSDSFSYTFRIRYRSHVRSLEHEEINSVQEKLRLKVMNELHAILR